MTGRDDLARLQQIDSQTRTSRIAALNDALRCHHRGGRLLVTAGVIALADGALPLILDAIAGFTDPYGEHDFGALEHGVERLFWKIDYYDRDMRYGSPDPADPAVTTRVLTVMLAGEY
jgi:hypothetical protein